MSIGKTQKTKFSIEDEKSQKRKLKIKSDKDKKPKTSNKLIVILGSTGSGKTEWAIKLAKKCQAEIVSADSRQVYKEMIVGTASPCQQNQKSKISEAEQSCYGAGKNQNDKSKCKEKKYLKPILIDKIPHHLFHIIYPNQEFNVAIYKKLAIKTIKDIQKRGKIPFLVGGTGLYIQAIVDNMNFPKVKPVEKLRKILGQKTEEQLFEIYKKLDPEGAKFIEKQNKRRLIRAIEVCKSTNKPFFQQRKRGKPIFNVLQIGIKIPKQELGKRIEKRVEKMFKLGLEQEARYLFKRYGFEISSMQTIGYQEWIFYLNRDRLMRVYLRYSSQSQASAQIVAKAEREKVKQEIILHTMQFAKRQMTWFKRDARIHWLKDFKQANKLIMDFLNIPKKLKNQSI